ncbi:DUF5675 family protein [Desulfocurvus sp.]|jgi:hypothetical protein|uniref:DUF5675 family protein n=1 Tax=Desulfocurvus sp. TaxID=2871698 RepID=UPI0025BC2D05|nr:DUF5675 family protein [Desulfocurvus sp.]MCK9239400.1 DUF5675 family protein [Desulfocurvus sp.]
MQLEPEVEIVRLEESPQGTLGALCVDGQLLCLTLEPPERQNRRDVSCIPAGRYRCARTVSPRFGETFAVRDVPGRSGIIFHGGNTVADTRGCVLLGERFAPPGAARGVQDSRRAVAAFMEALRGHDAFRLTIHRRGPAAAAA